MIWFTMVLMTSPSKAEHYFKITNKKSDHVQRLTVDVPMSLSDEHAQLTFDVIDPGVGNAAIYFNFSDPILNLLNKFDHDKLKISLLRVERLDGGRMVVSVDFDARLFIAYHELDKLRGINKANSESAFKRDIEPDAVIAWTPEPSEIDAGLSFTQLSTIRRDVNGMEEIVVLNRSNVGTK